MSENFDLSKGVWDREGYNDLGVPAYVRAVSIAFMIAAAVLVLGSAVSYHWQFSWWLVIGTFVVSVVGIIIFTKSRVSAISALGVAILAISEGILLGPLLKHYGQEAVLQALCATGGVMFVMSIGGIMFPRFFIKWGKWLMAALGVLLVIMFGQILLLFLGFEQAANQEWITWLGILIFTAFVAYDWSRALSLPRTVDNAIDASGALLLDAVNLFIRFLQIFGKKS